MRAAKCACTLALLLGAPADSSARSETEPDKPKVILETDFTLDVDDVGALAVLHALADRDEVEILAISYNEAQSDAAAAIRSVNAWYGRAELPIGVFRGRLAHPDDEHSRYIAPLARLTPHLGDAVAYSSRNMYRRVLSAQPDGSVTIVSVGFVNNLHDLLRSDPELVSSKVKELVLMGGVRNDGFNFVRHNLAGQTQYVLTNWPTPIVVSQEGADIQTGARLRETPAENPVREAYRRWWRGEARDRASWDQVAVLYGVRGLGDSFEAVALVKAACATASHGTWCPAGAPISACAWTSAKWKRLSRISWWPSLACGIRSDHETTEMGGLGRGAVMSVACRRTPCCVRVRRKFEVGSGALKEETLRAGARHVVAFRCSCRNRPATHVTLEGKPFWKPTPWKLRLRAVRSRSSTESSPAGRCWRPMPAANACAKSPAPFRKGLPPI